MTSNGFGDTLTIEEVIAQKERLLVGMARERARPEDFDDTLQEGRIALWQVATAKPTASQAYLHGAARLRMTDYATRHNPTGRPSQQGRQQVEASVSLDALADATHDDEGGLDALLLVAAEVLGDIEMAYHYGEIMAAISGLSEPQKRYVMLRFWGGMNDQEIAARVQVRADTLQRMWSKRVRPELAGRLAHLAAA